MKEIKEILLAYDRNLPQDKQMALATVVHVEGSSYRQPGARMLVTEDGHLTGAISGGCLEGDALRKARLAMTQKENLLVTYDTTDEGDAKLGVGLGCNGIIHILIEPIEHQNPQNPICLLRQALSKRQTTVLSTVFCWQDRRAPQPGTCLLLTENEALLHPSIHEEWKARLQSDATLAFTQKESVLVDYNPEFSLQAFLQVITPPISLVICGAGNDVVPLVNLASVLGWETTVVDGRSNYATPERFPAAQQVLVAKPDQVLRQLTPDDQTVFLLLTHNYNYDLAMLRQLLPLSLPYIGVLGPKKKRDALIEELKEESQTHSPEILQKLHGPTGLDLGAETSEEIALSILAEIKAVLSKRRGGFLREKQEPIHADESEETVPHFSTF